MRLKGACAIASSLSLEVSTTQGMTLEDGGLSHLAFQRRWEQCNAPKLPHSVTADHVSSFVLGWDISNQPACRTVGQLALRCCSHLTPCRVPESRQLQPTADV